MAYSKMGEGSPRQVVVGRPATGQMVLCFKFFASRNLAECPSRSALCYGRSSYIHYTDWDVPLPPLEVTNDFTFLALCELTVILDRILRNLHVVRPSCRSDNTREAMTTISKFGLELDTWKHRLDSMGHSLNGYLIPGFRMSSLVSRLLLCLTPLSGSLQLSYLAVALLLVRCVLDLELPLAAARSAYDSALKVTEEVVAFTASLTPEDLQGYFTTCESSSHRMLSMVD